MKFISQDGLTFKIDDKALKLCTKVSNSNLELVNLSGIDSNILRKVIYYCEIHQDDIIIPQISRPLKSNFIFEIVEFKDAEFITQSGVEEILQIIKVAEVLGIGTLVDLSCAYIALQIRGKNPEQIKLLLGNKRPKTDEEDQRERDIDHSAKGKQELDL